MFFFWCHFEKKGLIIKKAERCEPFSLIDWAFLFQMEEICMKTCHLFAEWPDERRDSWVNNLSPRLFLFQANSPSLGWLAYKQIENKLQHDMMLRRSHRAPDGCLDQLNYYQLTSRPIWLNGFALGYVVPRFTASRARFDFLLPYSLPV